jgi:hypothetical protein
MRTYKGHYTNNEVCIARSELHALEVKKATKAVIDSIAPVVE